MKKRRDFLKTLGVAGLGLTSLPTILSAKRPFNQIVHKDENIFTQIARQNTKQVFNMCGYRAPALDVVRMAVVGVGNRGRAAVRRLSLIEGVEIKAICDLVPSKVAESVKIAEEYGHEPDSYSNGNEDWKNICDRNDIDLVYIATTWEWHVPISVYAMERDKHVATEVPAATSLDECWQLVETSEKTRKHCVILENCCYDFFELLTLNMARQGLFGEIIHGEGAYIHGVRKGVAPDDLNHYQGYWFDWVQTDANPYPTHGLGPICQVMNINRGDKMEYMNTMSSDDFFYMPYFKERAKSDPEWAKLTKKRTRGSINTSMIRTHNGKTIMIQYDTTSARPYSRIHLVSGTRGIAQKWPLPGRIALGHDDWLNENDMAGLAEKYSPEIVKKIGDLAKQVGGHGGMDFMMDWRLIDLLRNGLPMDMDVYDAASWSCIIALSKWSLANRSSTVDIPDFTRGAWRTNSPVDISLQGAGNTGVVKSAEFGENEYG